MGTKKRVGLTAEAVETAEKMLEMSGIDQISLKDLQIIKLKLENPKISQTEIGKELGIGQRAVSHRLSKFNKSNWWLDSTASLQLLFPIAQISVLKGLLAGDPKTTTDYLKGMGIYNEKLHIKHESEQTNDDPLTLLQEVAQGTLERVKRQAIDIQQEPTDDTGEETDDN